MMPWESEEHMVNQELLEEAHAAFSSNFKQETWFERTIHFSWNSTVNCTLCNLSLKLSQTLNPLSAKRSAASLTAEAHLAKHLDWKVQLSTGHLQPELKDIIDVCKKVVSIMDEKIWLEAYPLSAADMDMLRPYLTGITAPVETINKGARKRFYNTIPLHKFIAMFDDAAHLRRGMTIVLGMGETFDDLPELHRFIEMNRIDKVIFLPVLPHKNTPFRKSPSSFYITRWIAETRIAFPKIEILAGTWKGRVAEVGLFLKAGANAITRFPAVKRFNSEDARSIEQEIATCHRTFTSTLTDVQKIYQLRNITTDEETKEKLLRYIQAIQEHV